MKLRFKHQKFQADAAKAVCDVFAGQPCNKSIRFNIDPGEAGAMLVNVAIPGYANAKLIPAMTKDVVLEQLQKVQREHQLKPSEKLEGTYNLTVEMETGVGKTYTYIKTMYELYDRYGWGKYIIVVPSIAIREGVFKTFQMTAEHFAEEYGKKIRFFIYNSRELSKVQQFAENRGINVMIINSQAFNAKGKDARRISMHLDEFHSRKPIDVLASTNPILIIDEPQSVEGKQTKERLKDFKPLITLRYSATHKADSVYNMVYRLDAQDAYNQKLVKRIAVKGIEEKGTSATDGYIYLQSINLSGASPTATIQFDCRGASGVRKKTATVSQGYNLYPNSGNMEEYRHGFVLKAIDARDGSVEFLNGTKLYLGDVVGNVNEEQLRRLQIRETILSHLERESQLFRRGIKVLSLFFIDEVKKYRDYETADERGMYAKMFEEEYADVLAHWQFELGSEAYQAYLNAIPVMKTHAGYFSQDKKGRFVDSETGRKLKTGMSDDVDAYDLIMKNKELLLERDPRRSPVRFIFSHSALREGWDNPNVFQICTLKQSSSEVRKRQEVGRGLRLCVNEHGERMDLNALQDEVHQVNVLTIIASESYENFARGLQSELAEAVADRPRKVTQDLFEGKTVKDRNGNMVVLDKEKTTAILYVMTMCGYVDRKGELMDKYYADKKAGLLNVAEEVADCKEAVLKIIDSVYDSRSMVPENARANNVELSVDKNKMAMPEFKALWKKINAKSVYVVDFDSEELIRKAISALDRKLNVAAPRFTVTTGTMTTIASRSALEEGTAFQQTGNLGGHVVEMEADQSVKYDLIGKIVEGTGLTRKDAADILCGIAPLTFSQFKKNPEEFIIKATNLINEEKATVIIEHITYHVTEERYETNVFTDPTIKGRLGANAMKTDKHLYDHLVYDSTNEKKFAEQLDTCEEVAVYVKLPKGFYINTPVGHYNPDWAISFREGDIKHIYFVAETKGSMDSLQLREIEKSKIHCAREHFKAISSDSVRYDVVDSYESLMNLVRG